MKVGTTWRCSPSAFPSCQVEWKTSPLFGNMMSVTLQSVGKEKNFFPSTHLRFFSWGPINQTGQRQTSKTKMNRSLVTCIVHVHMGAPSNEEAKRVVRTQAYISS